MRYQEAVLEALLENKGKFVLCKNVAQSVQHSDDPKIKSWIGSRKEDGWCDKDIDTELRNAIKHVLYKLLKKGFVKTVQIKNNAVFLKKVVCSDKKELVGFLVVHMITEKGIQELNRLRKIKEK